MALALTAACCLVATPEAAAKVQLTLDANGKPTTASLQVSTFNNFF